MQRAGGWLTAEDLASLPEPPVLPALSVSYRGWDVFTLPPPAAGWVVLLALNVLEQAPEGEGALHLRTLPGSTHFSVVDRSGLAVAVTQSGMVRES
jgi:gamma-glutamyltranspeptidase